MTRRPRVVVLDHGSGNLRSAQRALERVGAAVELTADRERAHTADGLVVPGVGAFATCMAGLTEVDGPRVITERLTVDAPVLGICVGAQVLFESGTERGVTTPGLGLFSGEVTRLTGDRVPHMGWNTVMDTVGLPLLAGVPTDTRFYFVHSYAARPPVPDAAVATCEYGDSFVAAVSRGPLSATQFHPEKSGDAGLAVLSNWVRGLR